MLSSAIVLWLIALVLGFFVYRRGPDEFKKAVHRAGEQMLSIIPRICLALLIAGFIGKLLPSEAVGHAIGFESGLKGILIASLFGLCMPSGPIIAFPIVMVLLGAGAGVPQITAFLTAWAVYAWHRLLIYEVTLMGWPFAIVRMASSLVLPLVAGVFADALCRLTGVGVP